MATILGAAFAGLLLAAAPGAVQGNQVFIGEQR